jgi:hypothetical protein
MKVYCYSKSSILSGCAATTLVLVIDNHIHRLFSLFRKRAAIIEGACISRGCVNVG